MATSSGGGVVASSSAGDGTLGWMERLRSKAASQQQANTQKSLQDLSKIVSFEIEIES